MLQFECERLTKKKKKFVKIPVSVWEGKDFLFQIKINLFFFF